MEKLAEFTESSQDLFYEALMTAPGTLCYGRITVDAHGLQGGGDVRQLLTACKERGVTPFLRAHYEFSPEYGIFMPQFGRALYRERDVPAEALTSGSLDVLLEAGKPQVVSIELSNKPYAYEVDIQDIHRIRSEILRQKFLPFLKARGYEIDIVIADFFEDDKKPLHFDLHLCMS